MTLLDLKFAGLALAAALTTCIATLLVTTAPVSAAAPVPIDAQSAPVVRVATADLDLAGPSGRRVLDSRIRKAARRVCADPGSPALRDIARVKACAALAADQAVFQIDNAVRYDTAGKAGAGGGS